ncbi:MAG: hypothetical protein IJI22_03215 [Bacilli bacterium]|nr:hypothetical protein [Bacilli bacterium]
MSNDLNKKINSVSLSDWLSEFHSEDELRELFLNMDKALKYIHEHGYCIEVFHPNYIQILNDRTDCIQFQKLVELSPDYSVKSDMIKQDIFNSAFIQIGIYTKTLKYLNVDFLRENFDSFAQFIPSSDVSYYRGVVQRGAAVYLSEFAEEKANRDLMDLEKQLDEGGNSTNKTLVKASDKRIDVDSVNSKINDQIYKQINGMNEAAFVNSLLIPAIVISVLAILLALGLLIS